MILNRKLQIVISALIGAFVFAVIEGARFAYRINELKNALGFLFPDEEMFKSLAEYLVAAALFGGLIGAIIAILRLKIILAIITGLCLGAFLDPALDLYRMLAWKIFGGRKFYWDYSGIEQFLDTYLIMYLWTGCYGALVALASQIFVRLTNGKPASKSSEPPPSPPEF